MKNPCSKDCPDRSSECHAHCEKYAEFEEYKWKNYAERKAKIEGDPTSQKRESCIRRNLLSRSNIRNRR